MADLKDKVNILGTEYKILYNLPEEEMPEGADGCMDCSTKTIKIAQFVVCRDSLQNAEEYIKQCLRHEIIHAFFHESGVWASSGSSDAWGMDETITDWFAIQSPKIFKAFQEVGCL